MINMGTYMMPPLGLKDIREYARRARILFHCSEKGYIDVVKIFESLPKYGVTVEVVPKEILGDKHGETFPAQPRILIREDVYERACIGQGRDRLTIAHEIGHLLLHGPEKLSLARFEENAKILTYCDPEWQANAFAGEFLAPYHFIKNLSIYDIHREYKVSVAAAHVQKNRKH